MSLNQYRDEIVEIVRNVKKTPNQEYDFDQDLSSQGLDSLDMIDVLFSLQEKYDLEIDEDSISEKEWNSINKIAEQVSKLQVS